MAIDLESGQSYQTSVGKVYLQDDGKLRELAEMVMQKYSSKLKHVDLEDIVFVMVEGDKGHFLAKAIKIPSIYRLFLRRNFIILFNVTMIDATAPGCQDKTMYHELKHINSDLDALIDHDTEDFSSILIDLGFDYKTNDKHIVDLKELERLCPWGQKSKPAAPK